MSDPPPAALPHLDRRALTGWRNAIIVAFGLGGLTVSAWGPRLPALKAALGIGPATIGLLLAGITVGSVGGLLLATPVTQRLGDRRGVCGALLAIAVAVTVLGAGAQLRSVPVLAVGFVLVGAGIGLLDVLINLEGAAVERNVGRTLLPLMHAAWSIGVALGAGVGAACAALGIPPSAQFVGEALVIAVVALASARAIPPGRRAEEEESELSRGERIGAWLRGWLDGRLLLIGLVMLGVELGEGSANSWLALAVHVDHGQSASLAALLLAVFAISEASTRIAGGPVVDRLGRVWTIRATTALGVLGLALFILGGGWLILPGVVLWAVGVSMGFPLGMSAAAEGGANPAARVSVVASLGYVANLGGPPVVGALAQSTTLLDALWLVVLFMLAAFAGAGALRRGAPA